MESEFCLELHKRGKDKIAKENATSNIPQINNPLLTFLNKSDLQFTSI